MNIYTYVLLGIGVAVLMDIGYLFGQWSYDLYLAKDSQPKWKRASLWPITVSEEETSCYDPWEYIPVTTSGDRKTYSLMMSVFFLPKLVYLAVVWGTVGVAYTVVALAYILASAVTWPLRKISS